jgi:hypothetical protein
MNDALSGLTGSHNSDGWIRIARSLEHPHGPNFSSALCPVCVAQALADELEKR